MNKRELYSLIIERFLSLPQADSILEENFTIHASSLSPEEAIGVTERKDYPILTGSDVMIEAVYKGTKGQAFTNAPADWSGSFKDLTGLDFENDPQARGLLIASINAAMGHYGLCDRMVHCKNDGPKKCGKETAEYIFMNYGDPKTLIVGYQPSIIENLSGILSNIRVLDLDPDNVSQLRFGIIVEDGSDLQLKKEARDWADLILCTGSTVCNGTLPDYLDTGKETLFYGTSLAGTAVLLGLKRICFSDL